MLHHKVKTFETQYKVFEQLTVAAAILDNPETACHEINRVLGAAPVGRYISNFHEIWF